MTHERKAANGAGSVYQQKDGLWAASLTIGWKNGRQVRKVVRSKSREVAEVKAAAMAGELRGRTFISRPEAMAAARKLGTHTAAQWHAKERATKECRYCSTPLNYWNTVKDHKTSILRGGSDAIDNVQPICWECNIEKGTTHADKFTHDGPTPRPFRVMPDREQQYRAAAERGGHRG